MADEHNTSFSSSDSESSSEFRAHMLNFVSLLLQNLDDTENLKLDVDEEIHETQILLHAQFHPSTPLSSVACAPTPSSPVNGSAIYFEENSHTSDADDEDDTNFKDFVSNWPERRQVKRQCLLMESDSSSDCEECDVYLIDAVPLPEEESPQNHVNNEKLESPAPSKKVEFGDHRGEPVNFFHAPMEPNNCSDCEECDVCLIDAAPLTEAAPPQKHVRCKKLEGPARSKKVEFVYHREEPVIFFHEPMEPNSFSDCEECCDCPIDAAPLPEEGLESVNDATVSDFNPSQELTLECTIWDSCCMSP